MTLRAALADLSARLTELRARAAGDDEERALAVNELALLWLELDGAARDLAVLRHDLDAALFDALPEKVTTLPGIGTFERGYASNRERFQSNRILDLALNRAAVDPETGERVIAAEAIERVRTVLDACLPLTASLGWRKTGLTTVLGDSWKDLHTRERGRKSIRHHG